MIRAIAAMSENRVIGINNQLPWHIPEDLKRFKSLTLNQTVVMGRKTFESLPRRPLPNRHNVVLTTCLSEIKGAECLSSVGALLNLYNDFWVIGGASIYKLLLPHIQQIELTVVRGVVEGDAYFPEFEDSFELVSAESLGSFEFRSYMRVENAL